MNDSELGRVEEPSRIQASRGDEVAQRAANYEIDEEESDPEPGHLVIFDDMVAGASHFKAMKLVLEERFPGATLSGLFLARSIRPNQDLVISIEEFE
jgi:hypothetical protein